MTKRACAHTHMQTSFLRTAELFSSLQVSPSIVQGCATRRSPVNGEWVTPQRTPRTSHEYTLPRKIPYPCINRLVTPSGSRTDDVFSSLQIWPPLYCAHLLGQQLSGRRAALRTSPPSAPNVPHAHFLSLWREIASEPCRSASQQRHAD